MEALSSPEEVFVRVDEPCAERKADILEKDAASAYTTMNKDSLMLSERALQATVSAPTYREIEYKLGVSAACMEGLDVTLESQLDDEVFALEGNTVFFAYPIPVGGGAAAPGSPCSLDEDCAGYNHFCINTANTNDEGRCGQCDPYSGTGCEGTNVPSCSESYDGNGTAYGVGTCQCDVVGSADCPAGQTCREPSCVGKSPYCAVDHDLDEGCTTTTIATKIATEAAVRA